MRLPRYSYEPHHLSFITKHPFRGLRSRIQLLYTSALEIGDLLRHHSGDFPTN